MRSLGAGLLLLCLAEAGFASKVQLSLLEQKTSTTTVYSIDTSDLGIEPFAAVQGTELQQAARYASVNGRLLFGLVELADADEILFQCEVDGVDLVVVRDEFNSFGSPLRILAAFSGHPIQVSKIMVLRISNGKVLSEQEISRKDSSYGWVARVFQ